MTNNQTNRKGGRTVVLSPNYQQAVCFPLQGENPIFKQATTTFQNPTYGGK